MHVCTHSVGSFHALTTRAHASMPASARLATRQRQHHQYFSLLTVLVQYVQQACPCNSARNGPSQVTITRQMANFPATLYTNEPLIRLFSLFLFLNRTTISIYIGKIYKMKRIFERNEKTTDTLFYHYFISFGEVGHFFWIILLSGDTSPCPNFFDRKGDSPLGSKFFSIPRELEGRGGALVYCLQLNNIT